MSKVRVLAVLNAVCFLLHLLPSQLSQANLFNQLTIGEVSDKYDTAFTPAGITFAIWGIIYLSLTGFCIYHAVKAFGTNPDHEANRDLRRIGYLFMLNNLATGLWTVVFVREMLLVSVVLILAQLLTLLLIHIRLGIFNPERPGPAKVFTQFPLSIYFAWICIATIANISAWLVSLNWNGWHLTGDAWAVIMVAIATALSLFLILNRRNPYVGLVVVWAFYGIVLKQKELTGTGEVSTAAWVGLGAVAAATLLQFFRNQRRANTESAAA